MATKPKPIKRYSLRTSLLTKYDSIYNILNDLSKNKDEAEIVARLSACFAIPRVQKRGKGLEAVLRDAVIGLKGKTTLTLNENIVRINSNISGSYQIALPFHVRNVMRHVRQGKIKL